MKKILGLDLGTNSIGWALIEKDEKNQIGKILDMGSGIVPMDSDLIKGFEEGNTITKAAARRQARGMRRNRQRFLLRRDRLVKSMKLLGLLSDNFEAGHKISVSPESLDEMHELFGTEKIPSDWVNYFLRKKGLSERLTKNELARVLLQFNGRRGFKSNRKTEKLELPVEFEEEKWPKFEKTIEEVKVASVKEELKPDGKPELKRGKAVFIVTLDDGRTGEFLRAKAPSWENERVELEVNLKTTKSGEQSISFSEPDKSDWQKRKEAFEKELEKSGKHPGEFLLENLVSDPNFKIRNRVVTRAYYQTELEEILKEQAKHYPLLVNEKVRSELSELLYKNNRQKQNEIKNQTVARTLVEDIIFYQRPLRSQKSSINKCRFETVEVPDAETGELKEVGVNVAAVSSPLYQEFRIWQTIHNLKFYQRKLEIQTEDGTEKVALDIEVTSHYLTPEAKEKLFEKFDSKEKIKQKEVLKVLELDEKTHRWNYPEDAELKGNETKHHFRKVFKKHNYDGEEILITLDKFERLWHLSFSLDNPVQLKEALIRHFGFPEKVAVHLALSHPFAAKYGAFSTRAVKKLLSVMRVGRYWKFEKVHPSVQKRIQDLITAEDHPDITVELRERLKELSSEVDFQGLPVWVASYVVYGRHSELDDSKIATYEEIEDLIVDQQELRNPIVTQMVNETLRLVADVWKEYGRPNHIHLELARELQKSADEKKKATDGINRNTRERERARALIREMKESRGNPNSKNDVDKLLLWEELAPAEKKEQLRNLKFKNLSEPTKAELDAYRLWFDQGFRSPYSGKPIRFSDLFDKTKYDIDHIIPKTRFFDDSFANKVIVELELNRDKTNKTAYEYVLGGSTKCPDLIKPGPYKALIEKTFTGKKKKLLLSEDLPKGFIERQLVDTRHIGRKLNALLSRVATHESDPVIVSGGRITDELKDSWGLHELMKEVVKWRFERMEKITGQPHVGKNAQGHWKLKGYSKRIDHRHHALDALVVACTTRSHIQYLHTLNASFKDDEQRRKYGRLLQNINGSLKTRRFKEPWPGFWRDAKEGMENIVVSHKNRNRILNKGVNWYRKFVQKDGRLVKENVRQTKGQLWAARQPLSAGTNRGIVQIKEKKEVSLKEALKNVEHVSGNKIRKQLKKALELNKGKQAATLKWLEEKPVIGYDGQPQKQFWIVPKESRTWPVEEACWFADSIVDAELREKVKERWESCHRNEHLYRLSLEIEPLENGQLISEVEIETYPLKSANRVGLLHNGQNSWTVKKLEKITDRNLSKKLIEHLETFEIDGKRGSAVAFSPEGIEAFDKTWGKPIESVRIYEDIGNKYALNGTYVETAKGTNLFFAIYEHHETKKRKYDTIGLMTAMERRMQGLPPAPEIPEHRLVQILSPNDTVYVPASEEEHHTLDFTKPETLRGGFYKFVSSSAYTPYFLPLTIADVIEKKVEFEVLNKSERTVETDGQKGKMIKENFIKVNVNRIGQVQPIAEIS